MARLLVRVPQKRAREVGRPVTWQKNVAAFYQGLDAPGRALCPAQILSRYAAGETMKAIANDLNTRGVPSPGAGRNRSERRTHGRWLVSALHVILHNPLYAGRVIWNRSSWVKHPDTGVRECRETPESGWVVHEVPGIALVDSRTWDLVQARLGRNRSAAGTKPGREGKSRYLLSGLLTCSVCGSKFIVMGGSQHRYTCGAYHGGGRNACSNHIRSSLSTFPGPCLSGPLGAIRGHH
jgi:site-specific DNA recombinase